MRASISRKLLTLSSLIFVVSASDSFVRLPRSANNSTPNNGTSSSASDRQGWTSSPNERGTIDIIWNSAFTMFLCSWSILCMNVAGPTDTPWLLFRRKLWLTALCFLGPEFTFVTSAGQWASARQSVRDFEAAGIEGWTITHAFFADMGGFILHTRCGFPPFPVDSKQLLFLITNGFVEKPSTEKEEIKDKNKVDGLLRLITLCQIVWFGVNIVGRAVQGLAITCIELTTAAFIVCNIGTVYCWIHKPADVTRAEHIYSPHSIEEIVETAYKYMDEQESNEQKKDSPLTVPKTHFYIRTPLEVLSRREWHWSKYWSNWINIIRHCGFVFEPTRRPVDRFENTEFSFVPGYLYYITLLTSAAYTGLFILAWDFEFPTKIERTLWRAASLTVPCVVLVYWTVTEWSFHTYPKLRSRFERLFSGGLYHVHERNATTQTHAWFGQKIRNSAHRVAASIRNNSIHKDPALDVPLKAILPMYVLGVFYCHARVFLFVEDIIELRSLPVTAYQTVNWSAFIPHI